ncbi:MAG: YdcH family protein [Luminiphilus sp.]|jgi:hypothetical protein|nr:YdcH family protein [Halieaceae bacterium]MCH1580687.1 YdcH family protein [Luminiphilus sp.]MDB2688158.1 YdcH family protein [Luminiphilus sp.]MDC1160907.1 YdcH family protein [Luminiphilus sp.]MDG1214644.1 YdcH family protein [Luminiphilus sp.]|tara:strand:+ start:148 stop:381 length:234 start_codon:yes stop_codon:yes gene_type:complete
MIDRVGPDHAAANEDLSAAERLALLQAQHRLLDQKIIDLQTRPWQNQLLVQRLKKEKLRLKEAIERLKDEIIPDLNA